MTAGCFALLAALAAEIKSSQGALRKPSVFLDLLVVFHSSLLPSMSETLSQVRFSPAAVLSPPHPSRRLPPRAPSRSLRCVQVGTLVGHNGWVTAIAFTPNTNEETMNMLVSASRDKTLLKWDLTRHQGEEYGRPRLLMRGHSNFVQDVVVSSDGQFALSGSWDGTLRLWDLTTGVSTRTFVGESCAAALLPATWLEPALHFPQISFV